MYADVMRRCVCVVYEMPDTWNDVALAFLETNNRNIFLTNISACLAAKLNPRASRHNRNKL